MIDGNLAMANSQQYDNEEQFNEAHYQHLLGKFKEKYPDIYFDQESTFHQSVLASFEQYGHITDAQENRMRNPLHFKSVGGSPFGGDIGVDRDYFSTFY